MLYSPNPVGSPSLKTFIKTLFPLAALSLLTACGGGPTATTSLASTEPGSTMPGGPFTGVRPQIVSGWLDDYDSAIEENIARNYPELLGIVSSRLSLLCPNWDRLDRGERQNFWSALFWSIAGPESARNRTVVFRESTMSNDSVTGQQIRSEGLLQLSYVDVVNHRYTGGDISWDHDRTMALADYASSVKYGNAERTILNAYANLNLGVHITHRLLFSLRPSESVETAMGRYWHTMRTTSSSFTKVKANLKTRMPACSS